MRIEQLTFTRFIAVIAVVFFHFGRTVFPFNIPALSFICSSAFVGVSYLYILSGFVMVIAYQQKSADKIVLKPFFISRFARVYPVYLLGLAITFIYFVIERRMYERADLMLSVFALQAWVPNYALSLNSPGWSVSVEIFFYLLFPFLFNYLYKKVVLKRLILYTVLIWMLTQVLLNTGLHTSFYKGFPSASHDLLYYFPLMHFNEFLTGNITGFLFLKYKNNKIHPGKWVVLLLFMLSVITVKYVTVLSNHDGLLAFLFAPMIYTLSLQKGWLKTFLSHRIFVWAGEISFAIFILQKPVFLFGRKYLPKMGLQSPDAQFYLLVAVLILLSSLVYFYFENPIRKKIVQLAAK